MKANGLFARRKRKFKITTDSNHKYTLAANILNQNFKVSRINQVWVLDITDVETNQGWMYLTIVIDIFKQKVVGWSKGNNLTTKGIIISPWAMAVKSNTILEELIFHSDRGAQYASYVFTDIIKSHNGLVKQSLSRKGNCWGNAGAESFFKSLKTEWVYTHKFDYRSQAKLPIFHWIETWYNKIRIHSILCINLLSNLNEKCITKMQLLRSRN